MRIVAGAARGRRLVAPKGDDVRPTADRAKEALFASLQPLLVDARVLDLFAGSGALGLEALSRGAASVTFVERDRAALQAIAANVEAVGLPGTEVVTQPVARALAQELPGAPFDLVLLDPPYRTPKAEVETVLASLIRHLAPGATVVIERSVRDGAPPWPPELVRGDPRRYGDTALHRASMPEVRDADVDPSTRVRDHSAAQPASDEPASAEPASDEPASAESAPDAPATDGSPSNGSV